MTGLVVLALLLLLALAATRWGADTHRSGEWDAPTDTWRRPDRPGRTHRLGRHA
ncbi:hypothetical protein [Angustibacter aerolatus]